MVACASTFLRFGVALIVSGARLLADQKDDPPYAIFALMRHASVGTNVVAGTAFAVDKRNGIFLTAGHVACQALTSDLNEAIVLRYYFSESRFETIRARLIAYGIDPLLREERKDTTDWAALTVVPEDLRKLQDLDLLEVTPADDLRLAPGDRVRKLPVTTIGFGNQVPPARAREGRITQVNAMEIKGFFRSSMVIAEGNSGGPVIGPDGLLGVATGRSLYAPVESGKASAVIDGDSDAIALEAIVFDLCRKLPTPPGLEVLEDFFKNRLPRSLTEAELRSLRACIKRLTALERYKLLQIARDGCPNLVQFLFINCQTELPATCDILKEILQQQRGGELTDFSLCSTSELAKALKDRREKQQSLKPEEQAAVDMMGEYLLGKRVRGSQLGADADLLMAEFAALPATTFSRSTASLLQAATANERAMGLVAELERSSKVSEKLNGDNVAIKVELLRTQIAKLQAEQKLSEREIQLAAYKVRLEEKIPNANPPKFWALTTPDQPNQTMQKKDDDPFELNFRGSVAAAPYSFPGTTDKGEAVYTVREGDTLTKISRKFLGDSSKWQEWLAVNPVLQKTGRLKVGQELVIPKN